MLYKILQNPNHPLNSELPDPFQPVGVTRRVLSVNSQALMVGRLAHLSEYCRCFIPDYGMSSLILLLSFRNFKSLRLVLILSCRDVNVYFLIVAVVFLKFYLLAISFILFSYFLSIYFFLRDCLLCWCLQVYSILANNNNDNTVNEPSH